MRIFFLFPFAFYPLLAEVLRPTSRICGQQGTFGLATFSFGLRVEFLRTFFYPLLALGPILGEEVPISEATDVQCRDLAACSMVFIDMYCSTCRFVASKCSFGLRVEFCDSFLSPFSFFALIFHHTSNFPGHFSSTATPECPFQKQPNCNSCDLAASKAVLHDMYCHTGSFVRIKCSFGLRVEFCDMFLSPSGPFGLIFAFSAFLLRTFQTAANHYI